MCSLQLGGVVFSFFLVRRRVNDADARATRTEVHQLPQQREVMRPDEAPNPEVEFVSIELGCWVRRLGRGRFVESVS